MGIAGGLVWRNGGGDLSQAWDLPADVLPVKEKYARLGLPELRNEKGKLKRLVADLSLDKQILKDIVATIL